MATDLSGVAADSAPATPSATPARGVPRPHRVRFGFIYGGLAAILVAAIAGVAVLASRSINPGPSWSAWKPSGGGQGAAKQIAEHVAKAYRLPTGEQMVDVISKAPSVSPSSTATIPIHYVAVRGRTRASNKDYPISSTNSVMYSLCGLGASCSIATGKASIERGRLVRREIFELALYTFKYVGGIDSVIAFMPPQPGTTPKYTVYLRKDDLKAQLEKPLVTTLAAKAPLPKTIPAREVRTIDAVTTPHVYSFSLAQSQTGDLILVLAPLPA